jgi:starch phosphorylase
MLNALRIVVLTTGCVKTRSSTWPRERSSFRKAAAAYQLAKLITKFINNLAGVIDADPDVAGGQVMPCRTTASRWRAADRSQRCSN